MTKCSQERILFSISDVYLQRLPSGLSEGKSSFPGRQTVLSATKKQIMKQLYIMVIQYGIHTARYICLLLLLTLFPALQAKEPEQLSNPEVLLATVQLHNRNLVTDFNLTAENTTNPNPTNEFVIV